SAGQPAASGHVAAAARTAVKANLRETFISSHPPGRDFIMPLTSQRPEPIDTLIPLVRPFQILVAATVAVGCAACGPARSAVSAVLAASARDIALVRDTVVVSARVTAGATLATILHAQQIATADAIELIERAGSVFDVRKVRVNQPYRLEKTPAGVIRSFD